MSLQSIAPSGLAVPYWRQSMDHKVIPAVDVARSLLVILAAAEASLPWTHSILRLFDARDRVDPEGQLLRTVCIIGGTIHANHVLLERFARQSAGSTVVHFASAGLIRMLAQYYNIEIGNCAPLSSRSRIPNNCIGLLLNSAMQPMTRIYDDEPQQSFEKKLRYLSH